jgi:mono/diheme cytochrome c family protein
MNVLRVIVRLMLTLFVLVIVILCALYLRGLQVANGKVQRRVPAVAAATDSASLARGAHLAQIACAACHGDQLAGPDTLFINSPVFAVVQPPNLTPGGMLQRASDGQLARAIREGVGFDDRRLFLMPSQAFHGMSDADLAAVIGYLRSLPPVVHETQPRKIGPIAAMLLASGKLPNKLPEPIETPIIGPPVGPTVEYGAYLTPMYGCKECHGANLKGIPPGGGPPPGPDIVRVAHAVTYEKFENAVRHGVGTTGLQLSMEMPWSFYARMDDVEVQAIYEYIKSLP